MIAPRVRYLDYKLRPKTDRGYVQSVEGWIYFDYYLFHNEKNLKSNYILWYYGLRLNNPDVDISSFVNHILNKVDVIDYNTLKYVLQLPREDVISYSRNNMIRYAKRVHTLFTENSGYEQEEKMHISKEFTDDIGREKLKDYIAFEADVLRNKDNFTKINSVRITDGVNGRDDNKIKLSSVRRRVRLSFDFSKDNASRFFNSEEDTNRFVRYLELGEVSIREAMDVLGIKSINTMTRLSKLKKEHVNNKQLNK